MKKLIIILLCILGISVFFNIKTHNRVKLLDQNIKAYTDSINIIQLKNKKMLYEKDAFVANEQNLKHLLDISDNEIKELKKKLNSSLHTIQQISSEINIDTIYTKDTIYHQNDTIIAVKFEYSDEWLKLNGITNIHPSVFTTIHNINIPVNIQTGFTDKNQIFVTTDNPYINITSIDGAKIDKKIELNNKVYIGIGAQYGLMNKSIDVGPQIGYGFTIKF